MKKLLIILLFCILTVGMTSIASAAENVANIMSAADWQWLRDTGNEESWFFDAQSLKKVSDTTYSVWVKMEYSEAKAKEVTEFFNFKTPFACSLSQYEFNFRDKTYRFLAVPTYYDTEGNVLLADDNRPDKWDPVFPKAVNETIFNATYDYYKKHYQ